MDKIPESFDDLEGFIERNRRVLEERLQKGRSLQAVRKRLREFLSGTFSTRDRSSEG